MIFIHDITSLSIDHGIHRFRRDFHARCIEFTIWPRNPSSSFSKERKRKREFSGFRHKLPRCTRPTKLHAISMTTAREPVRQFVTSLCTLHIEGESGFEGGRAVRQYFLSSHGQLADRLVRPLLAQHTTTRRQNAVVRESCLAIVCARVYVREPLPRSIYVRSVAYGPPSLGAIARFRRVDSTIAPLLSLPEVLSFQYYCAIATAAAKPQRADGRMERKKAEDTARGRSTTYMRIATLRSLRKFLISIKPR